MTCLICIYDRMGVLNAAPVSIAKKQDIICFEIFCLEYQVFFCNYI